MTLKQLQRCYQYRWGIFAETPNVARICCIIWKDFYVWLPGDAKFKISYPLAKKQLIFLHALYHKPACAKKAEEMLVDVGIITCFKDSSCSHAWNRVKTLTVIHGGGILPIGNVHPWRQNLNYESTVIHGGGILPIRKPSSMEATFYLRGNGHPESAFYLCGNGHPMDAAFYLWGTGHPWRWHFTNEKTDIHGSGI
jgi:hypothetical protein